MCAYMFVCVCVFVCLFDCVCVCVSCHTCSLHDTNVMQIYRKYFSICAIFSSVISLVFPSLSVCLSVFFSLSAAFSTNSFSDLNVLFKAQYFSYKQIKVLWALVLLLCAVCIACCVFVVCLLLCMFVGWFYHHLLLFVVILINAGGLLCSRAVYSVFCFLCYFFLFF